QWLQSRSILDIPINSAVVMASETAPAAVSTNSTANDVVSTNAVAVAGGPPGFGARGARAGFGGAGFGGRGFGRRSRVPTGTELNAEVRAAMKREVDSYFDYIVREDRSVLELLQSNYTFVNDQLAAVYGITNITG